MDDLKCILCGEPGDVHLNVADGDTFHCHQCEGEFTAGQVREHVGLWSKVLRWVDAHPAREDEPAATHDTEGVPL